MNKTPSPITIQGTLFPPLSSKSHEAQLYWQGESGGKGYFVIHYGKGSSLEGTAADITSEEAPFNTARSFLITGGARFQAPYSPELARLEAELSPRSPRRLLLAAEGNYAVLAGVFAVAVGVLLFVVQVGVPAGARYAAYRTSPAVAARLDEEVMTYLRDEMLEPSRLPVTRQAELKNQFAEVARWAGGHSGDHSKQHHSKQHYNLVLAHAPKLGVNAFALPAGTIVLTDQLVKFAHSDSEIMGVLAHETGHVTHRHGLASLYQSLGVGLLGVMLTGDLTAAAMAAPAALVQSRYSRRAEYEADEAAAEYLLSHGGTTQPLRDFFTRLAEETENEEAGGTVPEWLSSHPDTDKRIAHLLALEQEQAQK